MIEFISLHVYYLIERLEGDEFLVRIIKKLTIHINGMKKQVNVNH